MHTLFPRVMVQYTCPAESMHNTCMAKCNAFPPDHVTHMASTGLLKYLQAVLCNECLKALHQAMYGTSNTDLYLLHQVAFQLCNTY